MARFGSAENRGIRRRTMLHYLLIAVLSVVVSSILCLGLLYRHTVRSTLEDLRNRVEIMALHESSSLAQRKTSRSWISDSYIQMLNVDVYYVRRTGDEGKVRLFRYVTPINASEQNAENTDVGMYTTVSTSSTFDWQFINRILAGETVAEMSQFSYTNGRVFFVGAPITSSKGVVIGGVILMLPMAAFRTAIWSFAKMMIFAALIAIAFAVLLSVRQSGRLIRPIVEMTDVALRMSDGDYGNMVDVNSNDEVGELGRSINTLSIRLVRTIRSLRDERDRMRMIISSMSEGILAVDHLMHPVHHNLVFFSMLEIESVNEIYKSSREDLVMLTDAFRKAISEQTVCRVTVKNPSGRAILAAVSPVSPGSSGVGAVCLISDVSESQRLDQLRRDYVANISHELRTPLTGIRGMVEPLMDGIVETEDERQECYSIIHRETIRLEKLVAEMLDMSRLQDGRVVIDMELLELSTILKKAVRSMEAHATKAGVSLNVRLDSLPLHCMGNENRIEQVMIILLDNAIDFTPEGGSVTISARYVNDRQVAISVSDTGCGIEAKDLPLIWERFYKADKSRMCTKGTGLGLAIAKRVVELMGGEISVTSEPGAGSEFTFTLNR